MILINCPIRGTVYFMDLILTILIYILIFSCVIRHVFRTIEFLSDFRYKIINRRLERFKH